MDNVLRERRTSRLKLCVCAGSLLTCVGFLTAYGYSEQTGADGMWMIVMAYIFLEIGFVTSINGTSDQVFPQTQYCSMYYCGPQAVTYSTTNTQEQT